MKRQLVAIALAAVSACSGKDSRKAPARSEAADVAKDRRAIDSARMEMDRVAVAAPRQLAGSRWQLVRFQSSDDKVLTPERGAVYTVEFGSDGRVSVAAGCNRGTGDWQAVPPSGLMFGPLATTRAMCPPGSMSAHFLRDFQYMRSYVIVDGRLHVSLMADGGIYEFAPAEVAKEVEETPSSGASAAPVTFGCTDSTQARSFIHAAFSAGNPGTVKVTRAGKTFVLPQVRSGSGARYEGSGVVFWNKGRRATVTWLGTNLNCALVPE